MWSFNPYLSFTRYTYQDLIYFFGITLFVLVLLILFIIISLIIWIYITSVSLRGIANASKPQNIFNQFSENFKLNFINMTIMRKFRFVGRLPRTFKGLCYSVNKLPSSLRNHTTTTTVNLSFCNHKVCDANITSFV